MAIIWERMIEGHHYEVRTAGASIRLYRNGVNHSQWNPNRPLAGSIWDLLVLPTLFRDSGAIRDVLILGFGAGSVGRQIDALLEPERIVGIELDPIHLTIADGFFECAQSCQMVAADAVEWVQDNTSEDRYDVIIEDLYAEADGLPVRCVPMDTAWCAALGQMLRPGGLLIFNMIDPDKVKHLPIFQSKKLRQRFSESIMYRIQGYENRVVAFSDQPFKRAVLDAQMKQIIQKFPACRGVQKRYVMSRC
ncbi:MAG: hypothetical protein EA353_01600 [Puniceicoccaceae bacterium]|nr:MAG: hypothetical protein EA353_01600 [Puniceicoccaceae bacterium]